MIDDINNKNKSIIGYITGIIKQKDNQNII